MRYASHEAVPIRKKLNKMYVVIVISVKRFFSSTVSVLTQFSIVIPVTLLFQRNKTLIISFFFKMYTNLKTIYNIF